MDRARHASAVLRVRHAPGLGTSQLVDHERPVMEPAERPGLPRMWLAASRCWDGRPSSVVDVVLRDQLDVPDTGDRP